MSRLTWVFYYGVSLNLGEEMHSPEDKIIRDKSLGSSDF